MQKRSNIGIAFLSFPFRDCLCGHAQELSEFFLRYMILFTILFDLFRYNNILHFKLANSFPCLFSGCHKLSFHGEWYNDLHETYAEPH